MNRPKIEQETTAHCLVHFHSAQSFDASQTHRLASRARAQLYLKTRICAPIRHSSIRCVAVNVTMVSG